MHSKFSSREDVKIRARYSKRDLKEFVEKEEQVKKFMEQQEKLIGKPIKEQDKYLFDFVLNQKNSKCFSVWANSLLLKDLNLPESIDANEKKRLIEHIWKILPEDKEFDMTCNMVILLRSGSTNSLILHQ